MTLKYNRKSTQPLKPEMLISLELYDIASKFKEQIKIYIAFDHDELDKSVSKQFWDNDRHLEMKS